MKIKNKNRINQYLHYCRYFDLPKTVIWQPFIIIVLLTFKNASFSHFCWVPFISRTYWISSKFSFPRLVDDGHNGWLYKKQNSNLFQISLKTLQFC